MITIHYDFVDGFEVSFIQAEALLAVDINSNFSTNCLNYFSFDYPCRLIRKNGNHLLPGELLRNGHLYTNKEIRKVHNISKILMCGGIDF